MVEAPAALADVASLVCAAPAGEAFFAGCSAAALSSSFDGLPAKQLRDFPALDVDLGETGLSGEPGCFNTLVRTDDGGEQLEERGAEGSAAVLLAPRAAAASARADSGTLNNEGEGLATVAGCDESVTLACGDLPGEAVGAVNRPFLPDFASRAIELEAASMLDTLPESQNNSCDRSALII